MSMMQIISFLYQSDCIEGGHTCFLGDVKYRYLRIFVNQSSGNYKVNSFEAYYLKNENAKNLRVNSYLIAEDIKEYADYSNLDALTDVIVFGTAKFDGQGNIKFYDNDSNEVDEKYYADKVNLLKQKSAKERLTLSVILQCLTAMTMPISYQCSVMNMLTTLLQISLIL